MTWNEDYDLILLRAHTNGASDAAILSQLLEMSLPVCRADIIAARKRFGLRPNVTPAPQHRRFIHPKEVLNHRTEATIWLGERLRETPAMYYLDNRPVSFYPEVMRAINRQRKLAGEPQIDRDPEWVV